MEGGGEGGREGRGELILRTEKLSQPHPSHIPKLHSDTYM